MFIPGGGLCLRIRFNSGCNRQNCDDFSVREFNPFLLGLFDTDLITYERNPYSNTSASNRDLVSKRTLKQSLIKYSQKMEELSKN